VSSPGGCPTSLSPCFFFFRLSFFFFFLSRFLCFCASMPSFMDVMHSSMASIHRVLSSSSDDHSWRVFDGVLSLNGDLIPDLGKMLEERAEDMDEASFEDLFPDFKFHMMLKNSMYSISPLPSSSTSSTMACNSSLEETFCPIASSRTPNSSTSMLPLESSSTLAKRVP